MIIVEDDLAVWIIAVKVKDSKLMKRMREMEKHTCAHLIHKNEITDAFVEALRGEGGKG